MRNRKLIGEPEDAEAALDFYRALVTLLTLQAGGMIHIEASAWEALKGNVQLSLGCQHSGAALHLTILAPVPS